MENVYFLPVASSIIVFMLGIIGWFLVRFVHQYDEANKDHKSMFDKLLGKFDTLTETIYEYKTDVEVIKQQLTGHQKELSSVEQLWVLARKNEREIATLRGEKHH